MQEINYQGWRSLRLHNNSIELIITRDVGPRIIRCAFLERPNLFAEFEEQLGKSDEDEWKIRGGHRFWVAPEAMPWSYELDNQPYETATAIPNGVRTYQLPGPVTGLAKAMEITLAPDRNEITIRHTLTNHRDHPVRCAPWALSVMAPGGAAIVPRAPFVPHTEKVSPAQNMTLWAYTSLDDPRLSFGKRYIVLRQTDNPQPNKFGLKHREGWVAYQLGEQLLIKCFECSDDAIYPDGDVNLECFTNERMLEVESLGPLVSLATNESVSHTEVWKLFDGVAPADDEDAIATRIAPLA